MNKINILVVNPKPLYTQIAAYNNQKLVYLVNLQHSAEQLDGFKSYSDQVKVRSEAIINELLNNDIIIEDLKYVISRGGLIRPVSSGIYRVNELMRRDLICSPVGDDIVNIGGLISFEIASHYPGSVGLIADPVVVDELDEVARITGHPNFKRRSVFHALNQKAVAITHARSNSKNYEDLNLVVAHIGNGTTIGAHRKGKVIDITQGFDGDGPFSLIRSGSLPLGDVIKMCFSGEYNYLEMMSIVTHYGGVYAYLQTTSIDEIEKRINNGDAQASIVMEALAYQVSKYIGSMYTVLNCDVDAILITGDLAYSDFVIKLIIDRVQKLSPTFVYPGDNTISALANNAVRVLKGETSIKEYSV
jgi:butyrate kinase